MLVLVLLVLVLVLVLLDKGTHKRLRWGGHHQSRAVWCHACHAPLVVDGWETTEQPVLTAPSEKNTTKDKRRG